MTNDGTERKRLTDNRADDYGPQWSPTNQQIAFISNRAGDPALYLMTADGGDQREISGTEGVDDFSWSHSGEEIAFAVYSVKAQYTIYLLTVKTGTVQSLAQDTPFVPGLMWSPDDKTIAFISGYGPDDCVLHLVGLESRHERMSPVPASCSGATAWSPSGTRLAYVAQQGVGLFMLDLAQQHVVSLDQGLDLVSGLVWVNENQLGGFARGKIFVKAVDNGPTQYLTAFSDEQAASDLALSPDGKYFAFVRRTDTSATIWRLNVDGSGLVRLNP
jgi:Tol biopolymer transport system component